MTDKPDGKRWRWPTWIGTILALFAMYIGAYFATVQSVGYGSTGTWHRYAIGSYSLPWSVNRFFAPAHWIDSKLRPYRWSESDADIDDLLIQSTRTK
jgi:heme A synthase